METIQRFTAAVGVAAFVGVTALAAEAAPPFGGPDDVKFANDLWASLSRSKLVGKESIVTYPYKGTPPHGNVLEFMESTMTVDGITDPTMVKKNYRGDGDAEALEHAVLNDRLKYLTSITVMFRREKGYDPEDQNWFWVKYDPGGSVQQNDKGMSLAGRVAKGMSQGCIACHGQAPGGDYVYTHDRFAKK